MKSIEILVIEDEPVIQVTLETFLEASGYSFEIATSGEDALQKLEVFLPELILCDIMMPGLDGYGLCQKLKAQGTLERIPLIFLTALHNPEQIVKGFQVGAVDYVTKPFHFLELSARITTQLELARSRRKLSDYAASLEKLHEEKNHFLGMATHDLKNPLSIILLRAQMTQLKAQTITPEKLAVSMGQICSESQRMIDIISNLLDINRLESGQLELNLQSCDLQKMIDPLLEAWGEKAQMKKIELIACWNQTKIVLETDRRIITQVLENIISNAVKYSFPESRIWIEISAHDKELCFQIQDEGPGLTVDEQSKLFQKFARLSPRPTGGEHSTGLGLSIVKYLVEHLNGRIWCESEVGKGSRFFLTLPCESYAAERESVIQNV